jgi:ABC-type dipeptide/oligopeptide/nickel transport system permease subunit
MASAIIAEATLSFLGLGVPPEIPTWGSMLSDGRTYISTSWWLALFPGLCIFFKKDSRRKNECRLRIRHSPLNWN